MPDLDIYSLPYNYTGLDDPGMEGFWRSSSFYSAILQRQRLLALDPKFIRMGKLADGTPENGILGERRATAEMGKRGLEFKIEAAVQQIRQATATSQTK